MEGVVQKKAGRSLSSLPSFAKGLLYMQIHQLFHCGAFIYPGEGEIWQLIALYTQGAMEESAGWDQGVWCCYSINKYVGECSAEGYEELCWLILFLPSLS